MSSNIHTATAVSTTRRLLLIALGTLLMLGSLVALDSATSPASAGVAQAQTDPEPRSDYLVAFASGVAPEASDSTLAAADAVVSASIPALRLYAVSLTDTGAQALRADGSVTRVEADLVREVQGVPDDPAYGDQWALPQIGWDAAYGSTTPTGSATVAVLDTGVNPTDDLAGQLVPGASMLAGVEGTNDPNGHGTAMASIAAAGVDNGTGIAGVGYRGVSVMPVKVLDSDGLGQDSAIVEGVVYAADHGADVILMAFSNPGRSDALQAAADYAWSKGAVLVAATGNDASTANTFPAGLAKVVGVSATTRDDTLWSGSNSGDDTFLAAPGVDISSGSGSLTGTSASAAIAAGAAALVKANDPSASNGVVVGRLARTADPAGTVSDTGNGRVNLARALADVSTDPVVPEGVAGGGGPIVGPYVAAANNDAHVAPGWAPTNTATTFSTLYRKTTGGTVQHVRITLPVGYTSISVAAAAFSSGTWSAPVVDQAARTVDVQLTGGTGLATNNVDWARIDVTATTPAANQNGNAAEWDMETFTNTAGTAGGQDDNPPVLIGAVTNPSATITFVDAGGSPIAAPVLQNGIAATVRVRVTQAGSGIKYTDVAVPTCFSTPTAVTTTSSAGGTGGYSPTVIDGFIRMPGGSIPENGFLTVQFTTTPNCTSGSYLVSSDPSTNASNPPSGTNQSVSTTGGSLTVAAGLADLSITKTDSPDPVLPGGTLTYTIGVSNAGPNDASAVKVVDTLPAGVTFVSAAGTNWSCAHASGTVTCNRTGGNLAPGAAPDITIVVTAPLVGNSLVNSATVSSPNDNTPGNNTATATTTISNNAAPSLTTPTFVPVSPNTNTNLQASTTTSDSDGDQVKVDWVWKLTRGGNTCTIKTDTSPLAAAGSRSVSLDLSTSYPTSGCTGPNLGSVNPSKGDVVVVEATPTDAPGAVGLMGTSNVTIANSAPVVSLSGTNDLEVNEGTTHTYSYTISDADGDAITSVATSCSGTGTKVSGSDTNTNTTGSFQCTFADGPATSQVSVQVEDSDDALSNTDTQTVTVANVAPTVVLSGADSADESQTKTYTYTVSDPGADAATTSVVEDCGANGTRTDTAAADSFECTFPDGPASSTVSVTADDGDPADNTGSDEITVTIANVKPSISLTGPATADEGETKTYDFTVTDPGVDTHTVTTGCGAEGAKVAGSDAYNATTGAGSFQCFFADGPATTNVTATVTDSDGATDTDNQVVVVTVNNVAPVVTLAAGNDLSVNEGTQHTYDFTVTDSGPDTFTVVSVDCGANGTQVGSTTTTASGGSFVCSFPDGPNTSTVSVQVKDSDDALSNTDTQSVTIANVAPVVTLSGDDTANEGSTKTYSYTVTDAGTDAADTTVVESCGANGVKTDTAAANSFECTFPDGPASSTVSVTADDGDPADNTGSDEITVTIANVAPVVTLAAGNDLSVNEGTQHTYDFTVTDAGADTFTVVSVDCGANGTQVGSTATTASGGSFVCSFPDGPNTSTVSVQVKDSDDALSNTDTQSVTIANVAPVVTLSGDDTANEGSTKTYSYTVTDAGTDAADTTVVESCGANGVKTDTAAANSFECTFPDGPASSTVSVTADDGDPADNTGSDEITVTIANVKPSISLTGPATADEGETKTYDFTVTDPGVDTHTVTTGCGTEGAKVTGSDAYNATTGAGSFQCFFADGPATTNVTATVTDSDGATDTDNQVVVVTVNNVAPVVTLAAGNDLSVNEGTQHTYDFTVTDSGPDTFTVVSVSCGANGTQVGSTATTASGGSFVCSFPDGPNTSTVSVQVEDSDNALSNTDTQTVAVANVAPTVTLTGPATADEGQTKSYSFTVTDPGQDTFVLDEATCGANGTKSGQVFAAGTGAGSFDCTFPDGPDSSTVSVTVSDSDGAADTDTLEVTVSNVKPSITLTGAATADEGDTKTYSFTVTDPGQDTFVLDDTSCGAGGAQDGADTFNTTTGAGSFDCTFPDGPDSSTVSVTVSDSDGAADTDTLEVTVSNVAPTVTLTGPATADEGQTKSYSFTVTDPGQDTFVLDEATCGANGTKSGQVFAAGTGAGSFDCTFPDGPDSSTVSVTVSDSDGAADTDTLEVTVSNVKPSISLTGPATADEGETKTYDFTVTDPGVDTHTVTTGCGTEGAKVTGSDAYNATTGAGSFQCFFADGPATTNVTATVTDSDGATDTDNQVVVVTVNNLAPVVTLAAGNDLSVNEGTQHTYDFTVTDSGTDTFTVVSVDCGANGTQVGSTATTASGGSFVCSFPDGPADTDVSVQVEDSDGAADTDTQTVAVANVAPVVTLSAGNDLSVDEGGQRTYDFTVSDAGADTFTVVSVNCGANATQVGSTTTTASGGSFVCSFPDGPNTSTVSVQVKDSDDALSNTDTQSVTIANVAPVVTLAAGNDLSVNEGTQHTYGFTVTDAGADTFTVVSVDCGAHGTQVGSTATTASGGSFVCSFPDGPNTSTVSVQVKDSDDALSNTDTQSVTVANVAPVVTLTGPATADEGSTKTYTYTVSDAGTDAGATTVVEDCGANGTRTDTPAADSFDCTFPDGPNTSTVSVTANDGDPADNTGSDDIDVTVANVAPVVTLTSPTTEANVGQTKLYSFTIADPAGAADAQTFVAGYPDCGAGATLSGQSITFNGGSFECTFNAAGSSTVSVKVNDGTDNSNTASVVVSVNAPPTVDAGPNVSGPEGSTIALDGTVSDPEANPFTVKWTYTPGAGVDAGASCTFADDTSVDTTIKCTDDGTFTVKLEATDSKGAKSSDTATVTVSNANPVVTTSNPTPAPSAKNTAVSLTVNFTDAGSNDTHKAPAGGSCTVNWDDGSSSTGTVTEPAGTTQGTCAASHTYAGPGVYTVQVTVTDDDGGSGTVTIQVVVYDPSGGFVTGGGFINVGPGSYTADPTLTGRANFGFISQYKKNAMIPTGETEFNFQVGDLNFHSTAYTWLVVSGFKAQYKGTGTINGSGSYDFTLTAYDGQVSGGGGADKFRIRITAGNNGNAVVFDNRNGSATDMDVANPQIIAGGSIVIHK